MFAVGVYSLSSGCFVLGSLSSPGSPSWVCGCDSFVGLLLAVPAAWPVFLLLFWIAGLGCRLILLDVFLPTALMAGACW